MFSHKNLARNLSRYDKMYEIPHFGRLVNMLEKESLLEYVQSELKTIVGNLNFENLCEEKEKINHYLSFLESLSALPESAASAEPVEDQEVKDPQLEVTPEMTKPAGYKMARQLKGGLLEDADIYVPESIIRKMGFEEGDLISATEITTGKYEYCLVEKGSGYQNNNRVQLDFCVIEKEGNAIVCNRNINGNFLRYDEAPFTVLIKDHDVDAFNLSDSDIVDIAYYKDNPTRCKVIWKHTIDGEKHISPRPASNYKEAKSEKAEITDDFQNRLITLIGGASHETTYRDAFTSHGARFHYAEGTEPNIATHIQKSDLVLIVVPEISHTGAKITKKYCKKYNTPLIHSDTKGVSSLLLLAINHFRSSTVMGL